MIAAAIVIAAVALGDLVRPHGPPVTARSLVLSIAAGSATASLVVWGTGSPWWMAAVAVAVQAGWVLTSAETSRLPWGIPLVGLGLAVIAALAAPALDIDHDAWLVHWFRASELPALHGVTVESFLLGAACAAFLVSSANIIVRIALRLAGDEIAQTEQKLRGGRLLGPMERLFVFFLALGGNYVALAAVVAAKGILRFPEISRHDPHGYKAEYVLVGSFVSWAVAFVFVPLF